MKILVWFEPERVAPGTWLYEEHPEWLLSADPEGDAAMAAVVGWRSDLGGPDPVAVINSSDRPVTMGTIRWEPRTMSFHPGPKGEYCVVRWTAPGEGQHVVDAVFRAIDQETITDVHILHNSLSVDDGFLRLNGAGTETGSRLHLNLRAGDTLDFVVGWGNGAHMCDSTGLSAEIAGPGGATTWRPCAGRFRFGEATTPMKPMAISA